MHNDCDNDAGGGCADYDGVRDCDQCDFSHTQIDAVCASCNLEVVTVCLHVVMR